MPASVLLAALLCQSADPRVTVSVEPRIESLRYRFENPSTYDTPELVPHSFEQTYDADNTWLRVAVRHRVLTAPAEFAASITPAVTRRADDFDTFHQPDGDVVVSGTTGNATLRSWTVSESVTTVQWKALAAGVRYQYRRDVARFHDGDGIVTHTQPPGVTHRLVTTRETTTSEIHALSFVIDAKKAVGSHGSLYLRWSAAPLAVARLTVELPDKYPGQALQYSANVALMDIELRYRRSLGKWSLGGGVRGERSFNWKTTGEMHLTGAALLAEVGRR